MKLTMFGRQSAQGTIAPRLLVGLIVALTFMAQSTHAEGLEQDRADVRKMAQTTLTRLYGVQPEAKAIIEESVGYAVFSSFGMGISVTGGGKGEGVAFETKSKQEAFMKIVDVEAERGVELKIFHLVLVFHSRQKFDEFVDAGWELDARAAAVAQFSDKGAFAGAMSVSPGVSMYQLTGDRLAPALVAKGTGYYLDDALN